MRRALLQQWTHYLALLPYNLNWSITLGSAEADFLTAHPVVVCDVGARGGAPDELVPFYPFMMYNAFDADADESARLNALPHPFAEMRIWPHYVGATSGVTAFHLYAERGCSSVYHPSEQHLAAFGDKDKFRLEKTVDVVSVTLDEMVGTKGLRGPDFLKLDTQGSELDILRAATTVLESAHLVEVEVAFTAIYEGQPLCHEVAAFLAERGYELLYLSRHFAQRKEIYRGPARGQVTFGDALFGRREDQLRGASEESLLKYALLLINYGHIDFALQILGTYPRAASALPSIGRYFSRDSHGSDLRRVCVSQVDKLAMLWLHARRYNGFNNDSDRSWPIR